MVSVRTATSHSWVIARPVDDGLAVAPVRRPFSDPLYPEPSSHRGWIAEQPLPWLGPGQRRGGDRQLPALVAEGVVSREAAALLMVVLGQRASVLVIADRSRAGKTTLLEALLRLYPELDRRVRLRGSFETFSWESDLRFRPDRAVLVAEEISGHLPTYLWGPPVGRFLGWRARGCALAATAHADSMEDVARLFTGYPLRLPLPATAAFDVVLRLGPVRDGTTERFALTDIWSSRVTGSGGLVRSTLLDRDGLRDDAIAAVLERLGCVGDIGTHLGASPSGLTCTP